MTEKKNITEKKDAGDNSEFTFSGQLYVKPVPLILKILRAVTGVSLITAIWSLILRFLVVVRQNAIIKTDFKTFTIMVEYFIFKTVAKSTFTTLRASQIKNITLENRFRHLHLIAGAGFLVAGLFTGIHWFLDGLGAGYPYLALIGAFVIALGVTLDLILFIFIPDAQGEASLIITTDTHIYRIAGVDRSKADFFVKEFVKKSV